MRQSRLPDLFIVSEQNSMHHAIVLPSHQNHLALRLQHCNNAFYFRCCTILIEIAPLCKDVRVYILMARMASHIALSHDWRMLATLVLRQIVSIMTD